MSLSSLIDDRCYQGAAQISNVVMLLTVPYVSLRFLNFPKFLNRANLASKLFSKAAVAMVGIIIA